MPLSTLPIEIWERIIGSLNTYNRRAFCACCLVCRSWVPISRHYIYNEVYLQSPTGATKFLKCLCLDAADIGLYVNKLNLHEFRGRDPHERHWLSQALPTLSRCLLNVTHLTIDWIVPDTFNPPSWEALLNGFLNVTSFSLLFARFTRPMEALELIASFPKMTSLDIGRLRFIEDPRHVVTNPMIVPPPQLSTLNVQQMYVPFLLDWLTEHDIKIRSATFTSLYDMSMESIGRFAHMLGPSLEHISLCEPEIDDTHPEAFAAECFKLAANTHLRSVDINRMSAIDGLPWLSDLLSQIKSENLECVRFAITAHTVDVLQKVHWSQVDHILSQLPSIRVVKFRFFMDSSLWQSAAAFMKTQVPRLVDRGARIEFEL
ncbi:uncharacterized protein BT62DRAFT_341235 [Guyanagaster necrorhizus]|uniref:F-box domain-containing protein n=1 Tax=Guyanagaster necrorhizus TaxID=856835 RepID=A0A9P8AP45_9AGAR|nr:uncharacterized protein BT62DRAFT_341235 [Guyanagaster necrorhizus MCA 3950]KAG7442953.1 hypothetical protein BT62DRAFT_341235 [Guyanagaster necrorhizus MCA 3950]